MCMCVMKRDTVCIQLSHCMEQRFAFFNTLGKPLFSPQVPYTSICLYNMCYTSVCVESGMDLNSGEGLNRIRLPRGPSSSWMEQTSTLVAARSRLNMPRYYILHSYLAVVLLLFFFSAFFRRRRS